MSRDWIVDTVLEKIQAQFTCDPDYTVEQAIQMAALDCVTEETVTEFWWALEQYVRRDGTDQQL